MRSYYYRYVRIGILALALGFTFIVACRLFHQPSWVVNADAPFPEFLMDPSVTFPVLPAIVFTSCRGVAFATLAVFINYLLKFDKEGAPASFKEFLTHETLPWLALSLALCVYSIDENVSFYAYYTSFDARMHYDLLDFLLDALKRDNVLVLATICYALHASFGNASITKASSIVSIAFAAATALCCTYMTLWYLPAVIIPPFLTLIFSYEPKQEDPEAHDAVGPVSEGCDAAV